MTTTTPPSKIPKRPSYGELKFLGPPLYNQGELDMTQNDCMPNPETLSLEASRTALLIVDVQPEYWSECPAVRQDFPHFPAKMQSLIAHCRQQNTNRIIWVRADYSFEGSPWLQQFSRLHRGSIPPIVKNSSKWERFAEPHPDEIVMTKRSWSSTSDTELLDVLQESGIDTVLVCGLITSVCVQHSAFGIFEAGYRTILVTDACADRGLARHKAALALYGDYMYELRTVASVEQELLAAEEDEASILEDGFVVVKPRTHHHGTISMSSGSTTSLSTLGAEDEEVEQLS
jgi:nicotinamidase-related amidase